MANKKLVAAGKAAPVRKRVDGTNLDTGLAVSMSHYQKQCLKAIDDKYAYNENKFKENLAAGRAASLSKEQYSFFVNELLIQLTHNNNLIGTSACHRSQVKLNQRPRNQLPERPGHQVARSLFH